MGKWLGWDLRRALKTDEAAEESTEAAQAINIGLHRRLLRAKDRLAVYASDPRRHAAVRVRDSVRLADAMAGSYVVDCCLAAGLNIPLPLSEALQPFVPRGHLTQDDKLSEGFHSVGAAPAAR